MGKASGVMARRFAAILVTGAIAGICPGTGSAAADDPLPESCALPSSAMRPPDGPTLKAVEGAWGSALDVALAARDQLLREDPTLRGSPEQRQRKRETRLALMQSRIVANQQQIFIALGPERQELANRISDRLDGCIEQIRAAVMKELGG